jgi:hypothetical protein
MAMTNDDEIARLKAERDGLQMVLDDEGRNEDLFAHMRQHCYHQLKDLWGAVLFDWDSAPDHMKRHVHQIVKEGLDDVLNKLATLTPRQSALRVEASNLRRALVGLVGMDGKQDLEQMEMTMRFMPAPDADKAASINAIHALLATLPERPSNGSPADTRTVSAL